MIKIVLLKSVKSLGKAGSVVEVKRGYAVNYLVPSGFAAIATKSTISSVNSTMESVRKNDDIRKAEAKKIFDLINGSSVIMVRPASDDGKLYGSVSSKDVLEQMFESFTSLSKVIDKNQISFKEKIKNIGSFTCFINLYDDIDATLTILVGRNKEEAESFLEQKLAS